MGQRLQKSLLYWRTARHLKPSQVFWRLRYRLGNGRVPRYVAPDPLPPIDEPVAEQLRGLATHWAGAVPPDTVRVQSFLRGRFTFINKTVQSVRPLWRGLDVPEILLSGNHGAIAAWRQSQRVERTRARRPDLLR